MISYGQPELMITMPAGDLSKIFVNHDIIDDFINTSESANNSHKLSTH